MEAVYCKSAALAGLLQWGGASAPSPGSVSMATSTHIFRAAWLFGGGGGDRMPVAKHLDALSLLSVIQSGSVGLGC